MTRLAGLVKRLLCWFDDRLEDLLRACWRLACRCARDARVVITSPLLVALVWSVFPVTFSIRSASPPAAPERSPATGGKQEVVGDMTMEAHESELLWSFVESRTAPDAGSTQGPIQAPNLEDVDRALDRLRPALSTTMKRIEEARTHVAKGGVSPVAIRPDRGFSTWGQGLSSALRVLEVEAIRQADNGFPDRAVDCIKSGLHLISLTWAAVEEQYENQLLVAVLHLSFVRRISNPALYRGASRATLEELATLIAEVTPSTERLREWVLSEPQHALQVTSELFDLHGEVPVPLTDSVVELRPAPADVGAAIAALREVIAERATAGAACLGPGTQAAADGIRRVDDGIAALQQKPTMVGFLLDAGMSVVSRSQRARLFTRLVLRQGLMTLGSQVQPWLLIQRHGSLMEAAIGIELHRRATGRIEWTPAALEAVLPDSASGLIERGALCFTRSADDYSVELVPLR